MSDELVIIDVSNIAHRARHAIHDMSYDGEQTAAQFGVLKNIMEMQELFPGCRFAFCFDGGYKNRRSIAPEYKMNRQKNRTPEEDELRKDVQRQIRELGQVTLPACGFRNIWRARGFEADDLIAMACRTVPVQRIIVVSTDQDLYQLLKKKPRDVSIYNPAKKKIQTAKWFRREYGICPEFWSRVKAWAGCSSDGLTGLSGVGEKTAIRFMLGLLKPGTKTFKKFQADTSWELFRRNLRVTDLPFDGCPQFELAEDEWSQSNWDAACEELGISMLRDRPRGVKRRGFFEED